ncbi:MAG TPA: DNA-binding protein, partial [Gammaproteobacteria bacterium]|nr:DNA-binding protein [Gammaproteobacteria bacterium]
MARPGVTYEEVAEAALLTQSQGNNPTIEKVRVLLGTGSIGTINKHLRKWKTAQDCHSNMASQENLPETLLSALKDLWKTVANQAEEKISLLQADHQEDLSALREEADKYKSNNQRWQQLYNQWQEEKAKLANKELQLEEALLKSRNENGGLLSKLEVALKQLEEKQERIQELHRLHQQVQENLEHYRESAREERLLAQEQFEEQRRALLAEKKAVQEEMVLFKEKYAKLQEQYKEVLALNLGLERKQAELLSDCKSARQAHSESEGLKLEALERYKQGQALWQNTQVKLESKTAEAIELQVAV